jgi:hypothetical protein
LKGVRNWRSGVDVIDKDGGVGRGLGMGGGEEGRGSEREGSGGE